MLCRCHLVLRWVPRHGLPRHGGRKLSDRKWARCPPHGCKFADSMVRWWQGESSLHPLFSVIENTPAWVSHSWGIESVERFHPLTLSPSSESRTRQKTSTSCGSSSLWMMEQFRAPATHTGGGANIVGRALGMSPVIIRSLVTGRTE